MHKYHFFDLLYNYITCHYENKKVRQDLKCCYPCSKTNGKIMNFLHVLKENENKENDDVID